MSVPYLIASLPALSPDAAPALSIAEFRAACASALTKSQSAIVDALLDGAPCGDSFVCAWRDVDAQIRNAAVRKRAARRGIDPAPFLRSTSGCDIAATQAAEAAFALPDPMQRERALDRARWTALDALQGPQPMSFEAVLAYAVRLQIATRWSKCNQAQGDAFLNGLARQDASEQVIGNR